VSGARIEAFDGLGTRTSAVTNSSGYYELEVPSTGSITLRASKDGYSSLEHSVDLPRTVGVNFVLDLDERAIVLSGDYQMTLAADAACVQLPVEARTRTYDALMSPVTPEYYQGTLRNGTFRGAFIAQVAGRSARFFANDSETLIVERPAPSAFLVIDFVSGSAPVDEPSVTVPMVGSFEYCADADSDTFLCRVPRVTCRSSNHTLTLTRR
jgi:hypothetical protein